jgi:hypothetical protein
MRVQIGFTQARIHHCHLVSVVEDDEISFIAQQVSMPTKDAGTGGMKGAHPELSLKSADEALDSFAHLLSCFVGEGYRQDVPGMDLSFREQMGYPIRDDSGLPTSSAR